MKFKVGDKVKIKSLDWYNTFKDDEGVVDCGQWWFDKEMSRFCGKIVTICGVDDMFNWYSISEEKDPHTKYNNNMIECLVERNGKTYPYKIGDRVILKGNNRCATITDLKYNSWGNLTYYIKIDNDKDISVDYPTNLLLPYDNIDNMLEDVANEPQEKMVSLEDVCEFLDEHLYTGTSTGDYDYGQEYICSDFNNASDLIFALRKAMGE